LGSFEKSLAICRPTWMPSALTESLYMMFPDEEAKLRDPKFLDMLAAAHVRGIENFLRARAQ
jgi:N-acetylmuramoyl-L-alanine amidase